LRSGITAVTVVAALISGLSVLGSLIVVFDAMDKVSRNGMGDVGKGVMWMLFFASLTWFSIIIGQIAQVFIDIGDAMLDVTRR